MSSLEAELSPKRFWVYFQRSGHNRSHAFQLYLYNARLAKSFLFPLHILEIVIRNAIDDVFSSEFTIDWHIDGSFLGLLNPESHNSLQSVVSRFPAASKDTLISRISFDFWSNLFRPEYDRSIWQTRMRKLFPNNPTLTRASFHPVISRMNWVRNRIAHHEQILSLNCSQEHQTILDVVSYRSHDAADWLKCHSTVPQILRTYPNINGGTGPAVKDRCDNSFARVKDRVSLEEAMQHLRTKSFLLAEDDNGAPKAIIDWDFVAQFIADNLHGGMIDLTEHTLASAIAHTGAAGCFTNLSEDDSLISLGQVFKKNIRLALVLDQRSEPVGVIAKAHRRY
ncbi:Abi family protein [Pseudomonas panipatensis]|nr:Abi family protein [Pseudomonas panipatensis]